MSLGGLDVGTTVCRLIVFNNSGVVLTSAYREYLLIQSQDRLEIDPEMMWEAVRDVCREVAENIPEGDPLEAIAVSAMGDTLIATDRSFKAVHNALLAFDTRSKDQCDRLVDGMGFEAIHNVTGMPAHTMNSASKVLWLMDVAKEGGRAPDRFMCTEDFVIAKMTGRPVMSWTTAGRTMMFNRISRKWWSDILDYMEVGEEQLSTVVSPGTVAGKVTKRFAEYTGLSTDAVIVTAGHDQISSAVGSGAVRDGMVSDNTGTFECVIVGVGERREAEIDMSVLARNNLAFYTHAPEELWAAFAWFNAGSAVNWCRDNLFSLEKEQALEGGEDIYEIMFQGLDDRITKVMFQPHLTGAGTPWLNPVARGVLVDFDLGTDRYELLKAALQGIGYDLMANFNSFEEAGIAIQEIRATGGGSRSPYWAQLKADMTGRVVTVVHYSEASALGSVICAAAALGKFGSIVESAENMVKLGKTYEPDQKKHERYRAGLERYRELYHSLDQYRGKDEQ